MVSVVMDISVDSILGSLGFKKFEFVYCMVVKEMLEIRMVG